MSREFNVSLTLVIAAGITFDDDINNQPAQRLSAV